MTKIWIFSIFIIFSFAESCTDFDCVNQQLAQLSEKVELLEKENENLKIDVLNLEKIVRPGKIPASCQEYFDRGTTEDGKYQIKPNTEIEPFFVYCDFRNWF